LKGGGDEIISKPDLKREGGKEAKLREKIVRSGLFFERTQ